MNKKVSFHTNLFESKEVKPLYLSEQCFGEDFADWIIDKLREGEFSFNEPYDEDWGWEIEAQKDDERFFIRIDLMDKSIGEENAEWMISIEKPKSWFSFGKQNPFNFEKLCREIDEILTREPEINKISRAE